MAWSCAKVNLACSRHTNQAEPADSLVNFDLGEGLFEAGDLHDFNSGDL